MADILSTQELQAINKARQSGKQDLDTSNKVYLDDIISAVQNNNTNYGLRSFVDEAATAGVGTSKFDKDNWYNPDENREDVRAREQSGFGKIANGIAKAGVIALGTYASGTLGIIASVPSAVWELGNELDDPEKGVNVRRIADKAVDNPVNEYAEKWKQFGEEIFPNFRTEQEQSPEYQKEWGKHIVTPNFIGDSFLKNIGFTVGAIGGGATWSSALKSLKAFNTFPNYIKGLIASAEGDEAAVSELNAIAQAVKDGNIDFVLGKNASNLAKSAAKRLMKQEATLQLAGATIAAIGEGEVEGLGAREEFLTEYLDAAKASFYDKYNNLESTMLDEEMEKSKLGTSEGIFTSFIGPNENGIPTVQYAFTEKGKDAKKIRQQELINNYIKEQQEAEEQANHLASATMLLNIPILTASNTYQFGRLFSGGYKTLKNAARVKGKLNAVADDIATPGKITAEYTGKVNRALATIKGSLKRGAAEAAEEMVQGVVSSGTKGVASSRLAEYTNAGYDLDALHEFSSNFEAALQEGVDYLGDKQNWQEGFIGAVTGLFGLPGNITQEGRRWNGGIYEAYIEAGEKKNASEKAAEKLNKLVNSEAFQKRFHNWVRHVMFDKELSKATDKENEYLWHNADDSLLISDVMAFADAGKLNDLRDLVKTYSNMTAEDAEKLIGMYTNGKEETNSQFELDMSNTSPEELVEKVKKNAKSILDTIDKYEETYEYIKYKAPKNATDAYIKELVFTANKIDKSEKRFMTLLNEVLEGVKNFDATDAAGNKFATAEEKTRYYANLFGKIDYDKTANRSEQETAKIEKDLDEISKLVEGKADKAKVKDMLKLANDRNDFYHKLFTLSQPDGVQKHSEEATTQEQLNQASEQAGAEVRTERYKTISDIKKAYFKKDPEAELNDAFGTSRAKLINDLIDIRSNNKAADDFLDMIVAYREITKLNNRHGRTLSGDKKSLISYMSLGLFKNSNSVEELLSAADKLFPSYGSEAQGGIIFSVTQEMYDEAKEVVKASAAEYASKQDEHKTTAKKYNIQPKVPAEDDGGSPSYSDASPAPGNAPLPADMKSFLSKAASKSRVARKTQEKIDEKPKNDEENNAASEEKSGEIASSRLPYKTPDWKEVIFVPSDSLMSSDSESDFESDLFGDAAIDEYNNVDELSYTSIDIDDKHIILYYRGAIPEIASGETAKWRDGKDADLSDFYHEGVTEDRLKFKEIFNYLKSEKSFEYISKHLQVGDRVGFLIDPAVTKAVGNGKDVILMFVEGEKGIQILNALPDPDRIDNNNDAEGEYESRNEYYNLKELKAEILNEYHNYSKENPGKRFVFGKSSRVWGKRQGIVSYDGNQKAIRSIPGYSDNDAIVVIDGSGRAVSVRGTVDQMFDAVTSMNYLISKHENEQNNPLISPGSMFYLVPSGDTSDNSALKYIPVGLSIVRYNKDSMKLTDVPHFKKVNDAISNMANDLALAASKYEGKSVTELTEAGEGGHYKVKEDIKNDIDPIIRKHLEILQDIIDVHDIMFSVGVNTNGLALNIGTLVGKEKVLHNSNSPHMANLTAAELMTDIAAYNKHLQIKVTKDGLTSDLKYIQSLIDSGAITSDATSLYARNADFYIDPYDVENGEFKPIKREARNIDEKSTLAEELEDTEEGYTDYEEEEEDNESNEMPVPEVSSEEIDTMYGDDDDPYDGASETSFSDLPEETKSEVEELGVSQQYFDEEATDRQKAQLTTCTLTN